MCEKICAFLALNVLFGIKKQPESRLHWSKDPLLGVPTVQKIMPRNCFKKIRQYLHLNNRDTMLPREDPNYDKLFRLRPLLDAVSTAFREEYRPSKFLSVDEGKVKYKGRLKFKQYMPLKPVKRRIKIWVLADLTNGYLYAMQVYKAKKDGGQPEHGLGHRVVSDFVSNLQGKNYHIFSENFFTSIRLAEDLLANLYLCGTTHSNRTFPF